MVKVRHIDQLPYAFDVEVTAIGDSEDFTGRIQKIFAAACGEIIGGDILRWEGQTKEFKKTDIVWCSTSSMSRLGPTQARNVLPQSRKENYTMTVQPRPKRGLRWCDFRSARSEISTPSRRETGPH